MSASIAAFHFLRPWWLLLALAWLAAVIALVRARQHGGSLRRLADAALLPHLLVGAGRTRHAAAWLLAAVGVLVTLALAGPTWQRLAQPLYGDQAAQVVVVSLSRRMLARDVTPDRLERVRYKVRDLLHANAEGRNGLVAYAGAAFVVAPLTTDAHALDDLVAALAPDVMPVHGDAPARGIEAGLKLLRQGHARDGSVVLVTDRVDAAAFTAARKARGAGARVSVLGVGGDKGVPVKLADGELLADGDGIVMARQHPQQLRTLADAGGGIYVAMGAGKGDITALAGELRTVGGAQTQAPGHAERWRDMGPWLLLPVVLLAALAFRRGWLLILALLLLPTLPLPLRAGEPAPAASSRAAGAPVAPDVSAGGSALWHNANQRAARALAAGNLARARKLAHAPGLRGAAAYKAGDYARAAADFAQAPGAQAAYNRGNALAREGRYRQAIAAYDQALTQDPALADARANRAAVKDWLRRHPTQAPPQSRAQRHSSARPSGAGSSAPRSGSGHRQHSGGRAGQHGAPSSQPAPGDSRAHSSAASPARAASRGGDGGQPQPSGSAPANKHERNAGIRNARNALRKRLGAPAAGSSAQGFDLGDAPASATSVPPLPQPMQRALERVPDDPGGLLRRKFQLEYRERHGGRR